jgi:NitT/TauT family transport system permease protein/taurine transport system permease protein
VGLGYMLFVARDFYRTEVIVLGMIVIGVLWLLLDRLVLAPLERRTIERWGMVQRA